MSTTVPVIGLEANQRPRALRTISRLIFYALPRPDRGGVLSPIMLVMVFVLAILRGSILGILPIIPVAAMGGGHALEHPIGRLWASLCIVFFEELARFAYAAQAKRPTVALVAFLVLVQLVETFAYLYQSIASGVFQQVGMDAYLLSRLPATLVHLTVTVALIFGFRHRKQLPAIFAAVVIGHVAFDYWAPQAVAAITGVHLPSPAVPSGV